MNAICDTLSRYGVRSKRRRPCQYTFQDGQNVFETTQSGVSDAENENITTENNGMSITGSSLGAFIQQSLTAHLHTTDDKSLKRWSNLIHAN